MTFLVSRTRGWVLLGVPSVPIPRSQGSLLGLPRHRLPQWRVEAAPQPLFLALLILVERRGMRSNKTQGVCGGTSWKGPPGLCKASHACFHLNVLVSFLSRLWVISFSPRSHQDVAHLARNGCTVRTSTLWARRLTTHANSSLKHYPPNSRDDSLGSVCMVYYYYHHITNI